jgi:hypothetical protein
MKPMVRRLRVLEKTFLISTADQCEDGPAAILWARRMRRFQMEDGCVPSERQPAKPFHRNMTIADVLRQGRYGARCGREDFAR